jgi:hypothetical protein
MKPDYRQGGCWPTRQQELLLKAALLTGEPAIQAWERWISQVDINDLDQGSLRLMPLLARNLSRLNVEHPVMNKLKGTHRHCWFSNQTLFFEMASVVRTFQEAGIPVMILKGAALTLLYYRDCGARRMEDFDILIPYERAAEGLAIMRRYGWRPEKPIPDPTPKDYFRAVPSLGFTDSSNRMLDMHWHLLMECCQPDADLDFWSAAVTTEFQGLKVFALCPTDQLLHVCAHGLRWNYMPPLRWVADAMTVLEDSPQIDWDRLVEHARKRQLILPLRNALEYLRLLLDAPIPDSVTRHLGELPISHGEQIEYDAQIQPYELLGPWMLLRSTYVYYLRSANHGSGFARLLGFPRFLHHMYGLPMWRLLVTGVYRAALWPWRILRFRIVLSHR